VPLDRPRGELALRYEKLSLVQQRLVRAIGDAPGRDVFAKSFVQSLDAATSTVQKAKDAPEQTEYIVFDDRLGWRINDPVFERWLRLGPALDLGEAIDPTSIV
jgi:hypothetical protein